MVSFPLGLFPLSERLQLFRHLKTESGTKKSGAGQQPVLFRREIGALALRAGNGDFARHWPGKLFGVTANQTPPRKGPDLVGLSQEIQRVVGSFPNSLKKGPKLIERRFLRHKDDMCSDEQISPRQDRNKNFFSKLQLKPLRRRSSKTKRAASPRAAARLSRFWCCRYQSSSRTTRSTIMLSPVPV